MSATETLDRTPPIGRDRTHPRPYDRPSTSVRTFFGLLGVGVLLFNVALMISDRAPGFTRNLFGGFARRLSDRLDAENRARELTDANLPEGDAIVHIGVWGCAALLIMLTLWTWRGVIISAIAVFTASVIIEAAQGVYTSSREVEISDVAANATGVFLGAVSAACCFAAWSGGAALMRAVSEPS